MKDISGTRRALMKRCASCGPKILSDEELITAILTYCHVPGDIRSLAAEMIGRYAGLGGFAVSTYEEFGTFRGLDDDRALFLWGLCACASRASEQRRFDCTVSSPELAARLVRSRLATYAEEAHLAIYLDSELKYIDIRPASRTGTPLCELSVFEVTARANELGCENVIIARNRVPGDLTGDAERKRDLNTLGALRNAGITLIDILIIDGEDYTSMDRLGFFDWEIEKVRDIYRAGMGGAGNG